MRYPSDDGSQRSVTPFTLMRPVSRNTQNLVVAFAKAPKEGYVKTRLGSQIGTREALRIYTDLARETWSNLLRAGASLQFQVWLAFDPPQAEERMRNWLPGAEAYLPQSEGDLGVRIANVFRSGFQAGFDSILAIGTDAPDVGQRHYEEALARLHPGLAVVGPSMDGGFYLLGLSAPPPDLNALFTNLPWSTPKTREALRCNASRLGLAWGELELLADVDTLADLQRVRPGLLP